MFCKDLPWVTTIFVAACIVCIRVRHDWEGFVTYIFSRSLLLLALFVPLLEIDFANYPVKCLCQHVTDNFVEVPDTVFAVVRSAVTDIVCPILVCSAFTT